MKIDKDLLEEVMRLGGFETKEAAINAALEEFVRYRKQTEILQLEGKVEYYEDYDYKQLRKSSIKR